MSNYIEQANIPRSSATFEFVSKFPKLHMPALRLANPALGNPKNTGAFQDGELVHVTQNSLVNKLAVAGDIAALTSFQCVYITHGKLGRTDLQAAGARPVVKEEDFEFRTKLVEGSFTEGAKAAPLVLTTGNYAGTCGLGPATAGEFVAVYLRNEGDGWHTFRWQRGEIPPAPIPPGP